MLSEKLSPFWHGLFDVPTKSERTSTTYYPSSIVCWVENFYTTCLSNWGRQWLSWWCTDVSPNRSRETPRLRRITTGYYTCFIIKEILEVKLVGCHGYCKNFQFFFNRFIHSYSNQLYVTTIILEKEGFNLPLGVTNVRRIGVRTREREKNLKKRINGV